MNRGSLQLTPVGLRALAASMRPRFMNRGSDAGRSRIARNQGGFNEAPIHESGKFRSPPTRRIPANRFNEAPIHESGKSRAPASVSRLPHGLQ